MAARLTRAKKKIAAARIPYRVPSAEELPERVAAVLTTVHLVFTTGHTAPAGEQLVRDDLVERAIDLARMLHALLPADREVAGLLSLILLTNARSPARTTPDGELVLLADQDRSRWDRDAIAEGLALLPGRCAPPPGRFALMAAIAAAHADAAPSRTPPGPRSSRSTRRSNAPGPLRSSRSTAPPPSASHAGRRPALRRSTPWTPSRRSRPTATSPPRAPTSSRAWAGRVRRANAYEEALMLTENAVERDFLERRLAAL